MSDPLPTGPGAPHPPGPTPPTGPAPGWYPDPSGVARWWDGTAWGQAAPPVPVPVTYQVPATLEEQRGLATLVHVLGIFTNIIGPLIVYLVARPDQTFVKHHAAEELNFQITLFVAYIVCFVTMLVLIGFVLFFVVWIGSLILMVMAAIAANRGEWYRYPVNIRLVSGALGG